MRRPLYPQFLHGITEVHKKSDGDNRHAPILKNKQYRIKKIKQDSKNLDPAFIRCCEFAAHEIFKGEKRQIRQLIGDKLKNFVSLRDLQTKAKPENYYHGFLNGLISASAQGSFVDYGSNVDAGDGYADIMFSSPDYSVGVVIELKSTKDNTKLSQLAEEALAQIRAKNYLEAFADNDAEKVYCYGISFCRRNCKVRCEVKTL